MTLALAVSGAALFVACGGGAAQPTRTSTGLAGTVPVPATDATPSTATIAPRTSSPPTPMPATSTPAMPAPEAEPSVDPPALTSVTPEPASATETGTPALPAVTETPSPTPARLLDHGKWHYSPSGSPCVYNELKRIQALYRNFAYDEVILMDSENCAGTWYVFYPSTGEAVGGLQDPDDPRLRLRLIGGKVTVTAGKDGCTWIESRRQADSTGRTIVSLDTNCGKYDYGIWYFPQTGELQFVIA